MHIESASSPSRYRRLRVLPRLSLAGFMVIAIAICLIAVQPSKALATCADNQTSCDGTTTGSSATVTPANTAGRCKYLFQNTGKTNGLHVAIGSNNAATTSDLYLAPGDSLYCMNFQGKGCESGDFAVIQDTGSTTYTYIGSNC